MARNGLFLFFKIQLGGTLGSGLGAGARRLSEERRRAPAPPRPLWGQICPTAGQAGAVLTTGTIKKSNTKF